MSTDKDRLITNGENPRFRTLLTREALDGARAFTAIALANAGFSAAEIGVVMSVPEEEARRIVEQNFALVAITRGTWRFEHGVWNEFPWPSDAPTRPSPTIRRISTVAAIGLLDLAGLSADDIGRVFRISDAAARSRVKRARAIREKTGEGQSMPPPRAAKRTPDA